MKFFDLFSGVGGFRGGLEANGHECVGYVEKDKFARKSYQAMYNTENEWTKEDITAVTNEEFAELKGKVDIITGGFPCFAAGTLITTSKGMKNIEDIVKGDMVLTHTNTFKEVVLPMVKHKKGIYELKIQGSPKTCVTEEHPYYVREKEYLWDNDSNTYKDFISEPKWVNVKDLDATKHYVGFSQNTLSKNPYAITDIEAFLIGLYISKGHIIDDNHRNLKEGSVNNVAFRIKKTNLEEFKTFIKGYDYQEREFLNYVLIIFSDTRLFDLISKCGIKPYEATISGFLLDLPKELLDKVLDGYTFNWTDITSLNGVYKISTSHKEKVYSLAQAVQKVYNTTYAIEMLTEHTSLAYDSNDCVHVLSFKKEPNIADFDAFYKDNMLWSPVEEVVYDPEFYGDVYNFEVAEDNSYVANNATVHNCQSFSVGGKQLGMKDDRGLLFLEVVRLTEVIKPKYVLMENVKGLLSNRSTLDDEAGIAELLIGIEQFVLSNSQKLTPKTEYSTFIHNLSYYAEHLKGKETIIDDFISQSFVSEKLIKGVLNFECGTFNIIVNKFSEIGYNMEWRVFNSSDFGVSQSRERVYLVAHLREAETKPVLFSIGTHERIVDFRESKKIGKGENHTIDVIPIINPAFRKKKINGRIFKEPNEDMYTVTKIGTHGFLLASKDEFTGGHKGEFSDKLHQMFELSEYNNCKDLYYTSRKITPLEAWELMGYEEEQFEKASLVNKEYALYQQAGNSITPQIVYNIGLLLD